MNVNPIDHNPKTPQKTSSKTTSRTLWHIHGMIQTALLKCTLDKLIKRVNQACFRHKYTSATLWVIVAEPGAFVR